MLYVSVAYLHARPVILEEPAMSSQTVAEKVTGAMGTWEGDQPLYAQIAKAQGMMLKDIEPLDIQRPPTLAERLRHASKPQHSER